MLELSDVSVSIKRTRILQGVALHVPNGSVVGLIGRNGAGKTTLMRTVMGFLPAEQGEVRFQDQSLSRLSAHARARVGIGYMPEDRKLVPTLTVEENILLSFWATKTFCASEFFCLLIAFLHPLQSSFSANIAIF